MNTTPASSPESETAIPISPAKERYEGLDQLRGILAFSVMIYHYTEWAEWHLPWQIAKPLALLGLYAVSTFYTLSGCALYIVYRDRKLQKRFISEFWFKRIFRIVPLFWLTSILTLLMLQGSRGESDFHDPWKVFLNFSLLFSWLDPSAYFATGAWSIGNEWAFYTLFPIILLCIRSRSGIGILVGVTFVITAWFCFGILDADLSVKDQWNSYIHPLNQLVLFVSGVMIGPWILAAKARPHLPIFVYLAMGVFLIISYIASVPACISGVLRFLLVGVCVTLCAGFAVTRLKRGPITSSLTFLGTISYTVYLMHPIMYQAVNKIYGKVQSILGAEIIGNFTQSLLIFICSIISTVCVSWLIYRSIEVPLVRLGRSLAQRITHLSFSRSDSNPS